MGWGASGVDGTDPWWQRVDEAAQLLVSTVNAAAAKAGKDGVYTPPPGRPDPRRRRRPASLRHLAEVIRTHRMAPSLAVDKDIVGGVLAGELRYLTDPVAVVAVARAAHHITGSTFGDEDARRLTVAVEHLNILIAQAREADVRAPALLPVPRASAGLIVDARPVPRPPGRRRRVPVRGVAVVGALVAVAGGLAWAFAWPEEDHACREGVVGDEIIADASTVFDDDQATRLSPTLDFDAMNGSARYASRQGRIYYWGRAGSDDATPHAGGTRVRWRIADGPWHSCASPLPLAERGYIHSPAVSTTIGGQPVTIQVCLWRDEPNRENCTAEIATG
ncbi:hypothetical protein [Actinoplanes sp. CA-252034]|uniref:hypothetical protein n=1 Tax=Actinoplanes sp. CA-252034 TaxID=3239906 RepID=UPI003D9918BA